MLQSAPLLARGCSARKEDDNRRSGGRSDGRAPIMRRARTVSAIRCLAGAAIWAVSILAAAADLPQSRFEAPRVVVFGDVHGAYGALTELLVQAEIIDSDMTWRGGTTHLVSLGDLMDRGPDSRQVMDLLRRLQHEAREVGGRVHVVLGNHELMMLTGDRRYVSAAEYAAFADSGSDAAPDASDGAEERADRPRGFEQLAAAFAADGDYGSWLLDQPTVVIVNDSVFVHGGLSPLAGDYSPEQLNALVQSRLRELLGLRAQLESDGVLAAHRETTEAAAELRARLTDDSADGEERTDQIAAPHRATVERFIELAEDPLLADEGPHWYRGNAGCHPLIETPQLERVLDAWQVNRVVVGHTPTADARVRARLDGRVLLTDTGMLAEYYRGRASAVILDDQGARVVYASEPGTVPPDEDPGTLLYPLVEADVLRALADGPLTPRPDRDSSLGQAVELNTAGIDVQGWFRPLGKRQIEAELAAFRLDRLLGLHLAAPVARRSVNGADGIVTALWPGVVTEAERAERDLMPHNNCRSGYSALLLLYAFDGLIQNQGRNTDSILYDRRTWRLASSGHQDSFGRGRSLPAYLDASPRILPGALADGLRRLDAASLAEALGDGLNSGQLRALLARRDHMLATWTIGD
jgi:hypothetical protein